MPSAGVATTTTTLAAQVFAPSDLRLVAMDLGAIAPDKVRIRFRAGGICGSDIHYFSHARNGDFSIREPLTLGHEIAGEVVVCGAGVTGLSPGDRVAIEPARCCGTCARCRESRSNLCDDTFFMGSASKTPHIQGGFATLFDVNPQQCHPIPDGLSFEAAALAEPLSVCLHAVGRAGDLSGAGVLVTGAGPIGLLTAMLARHRGAAAVVVTDIRPVALALAATLGFHTRGPGEKAATAIDVVFEAAGAAPALEDALRTVRRGGKVVQIGNIAEKMVPVPVNLLVANEIDLLGAFRFGTEFSTAVALIAEGAIDVSRIITSRTALADAPSAFARATDPFNAGKVILLGADV